MTEPPPPPPRSSSRGPLVLGIVIGVLFIAAILALNIFGGPAVQATGGVLLIVPLIVLIVAAIVLAAFTRTSAIGAGLLIACGIWLLVGAGLCVAFFTGIGRTA